MMKITKSPKKKDIQRKWHIIDAKGKILGKIATKTADILRGKNKVIFAPHADCGDFVIVINAKHVALTGKKMEKKEYFTHSRYFGHLKVKTAKKVIEDKPEDIIYDAVKGMLPGNKLRDVALKRLKIYAESEYKETAQQPMTVDIH